MNTMGGHDIEEIQVGMRGTYAKTVTETDIILFAGVTGDNNPVHIDAEAANTPVKARADLRFRTARSMFTKDSR